MSEMAIASTETTLAPAATDRSRHVPGYIYSSPEIFEREKREVFLKDWLCVARIEEVEDPGDYMTFRIADEPIVVSRDSSGQIHAFANVCRHRGVEVASGAGNTAEFSCPYHGWLYDLTGALIGAPYMKEAEGFDPGNCALRPLLSDVWAGWIFVNFDLDAEPLGDFVAEFEADFSLLRQQDCRLADKLITELDCNWKLINENIVDVYHFQVLHARSFGSVIDGEKFPFNTKRRGGYSSFFDASPTTPDGKTRFRRMPWLDDRPDSFGCGGFLAPNLNIIARIDAVQPFVAWPVGPNRTKLITYTLFPAEFFDDPEFEDKLADYREAMVTLIEEDRDMSNSLQQAMNTQSFKPGPMSRLETLVHNIIDAHLTRIGETPEGWVSGSAN